MDTVRSEYSEGSLGSSRLDDGSATDRSFSFSTSSRLSFSANTRSDYFSSYERKFQDRKAAKHKKSEKAKREKEKADRLQIFSADQRRQAQREAERQARKREMATWLSDPNELRRIERRSQKRSRDRMRTLREWYKPAISGPLEEVQPVFVAAMNQDRDKQEHSTRKKTLRPVLTKEAAALKDEEERETLQVLLHKQLTAFTSKLEYLEQVTDTVPVRAKIRAGVRRRRRVAREDMVLAPLGQVRKLKAAQSVATLPSCYRGKGERKLSSSTSLHTLRSQVGNENDEIALDDAEVEEYLLRHRKGARLAYAAVKLQAIWRMYLRRRKYLPWRQRRTKHRRAIFEIWVMTYKVGYRAQRSQLRKYFTIWRVEVVEALQLQGMELHLFRQAATQTELPRLVFNLVFTSDWEDERAKRLAEKAAEAAKKKEVAPSSKAAFLNAFLSATFGDMESSTDKRSRVHQLRAQHIAAREEVRKKIVQHVFRLWKRVHETNKRVGLNAQLCLKRAVRMAFGTRQRWPAEILLSVFEIWARWASFNRCRRLGLPLPQFAQSNPHWDIWLHNYQERQVRCVKAAAKAPVARIRRFFVRLHAFARNIIRKRYVLALASKHYNISLRRHILLEWRAAIADSAAEKKIIRSVMLRMHRYASAKRKLRPLKQVLRQRQREWFSCRAWRAWKTVQLHASFKREFNLSRLENCPVWRSLLNRTLDLWRDERKSLLLWRTFGAWTHVVRKRKVFLTLRMLCTRLQRRNLLYGVFTAWKAAKYDRVDGFLEDDLRLDAWDAYRELSAYFPMMFYGTFSDAGSIFGGLPSNMYGEAGAAQRGNQELMLATSGDTTRHFHGVLVRDSVMDVRNAILQTRHLVNAVDDASGNTALHVAAQIEEPERRLDIISLLLSEGAATLRRVNRHGLSPVQLAPDRDTRVLLDEGIFAFHSRNVFNHNVTESTEGNQRLLWCMVTLMSREWKVGLRIPANVRTGQWHSTLREELWLRQKRIRFDPNSTFAPAVLRSRGFLNALKTRLFSETGEYAPYARYLLATTLDTDACEQELIPSFVGLLFSLEFSLDDVLSQAYRLERECVAGESELWKLYQRIQHAEEAWSKLIAQEDPMGVVYSTIEIGMLRFFPDDADLFFRRELFLLEFENFNASDRGVTRDGMNIQQEALAFEIDPLMIRTKRELRKVEKKIKRVQEQIDEKEKYYRETLFASTRRVEDICVTRLALEHSRLKMATALIKYNKMKDVVARLEYAKEVLQSESISIDQTRPAPDKLFSSYAALSFSERKSLLNKATAKYTRMFQNKISLEEGNALENNNNRISQESRIETLPETLYLLQKEAVSKLHKLFVTNLLRICCCWLAENMIAIEESVKVENLTDSENDVSDEESSLLRESNDSTEPGRSRLHSNAGPAFGEGTSRRRSSIQNTRRVLDSYPQMNSRLNLFDPDSDIMNATYEASSTLLFEEERRAAQEAEQTVLNTEKETIAVISERNPITGEVEMPPDHIVNIDAIRDSEPTASHSAMKKKTIRRNRKKEELQRAMMHRRLHNKYSEEDEDENLEISHPLLPAIHGIDLHFGNFVIGSSEDHHLQVTTISNDTTAFESESQDSLITEAMWKRGGIKTSDNTTPSIKEVLEKAHRGSISTQKLRPNSRGQGIAMQTPLEVSRPSQKEQESDAGHSEMSKDHLNPPRLNTVSSGNDKKTDRIGSSGVVTSTFEQGALVPMTIVTPELATATRNVEHDKLPSPHDDNTNVEEPECLTTSIVQINTTTRLTSANSVQAEQEKVDTAAERGNLDHGNQGVEHVASGIIDNCGASPDIFCTVAELGDDETTLLQVDKLDQIIASPIVEISTSRTSESASGRCNSSKVPTTTDESYALENDSLVSSVNPFVKWDDVSTLEAFPLAVTPNNQSSSVVVGNLQNSSNRTDNTLISRVNNLQGLTARMEIDKRTAMRSVLAATMDNEYLPELSSEETYEGFALQGVSLNMTKTRTFKSSATRSIDDLKSPKLSEQTFGNESEATDNSVRPMSVSVVTKSMKREENVLEVIPIEAVTTVPVLPLVNYRISPPKPFVKLDEGLDGEQHIDTSANFQLEGTGLTSPAPPKTSVEVFRLNVDSSVSPRTFRGDLQFSRVRSRQSRSRLPSTSTTNDLVLLGSRLDGSKTYIPEQTFEDITPMSKAEKERLWQQFAAEPLSVSVQDAYSILYPQTYAGSATESQNQQEVQTTPLNVSTLTKNSPPMENLSCSSLRVDSTRQPMQKTIEVTRKFWSAVEGYRSIGTSSILPLDTATIYQRRLDKAHTIFDHFFLEHPEMTDNGESRGLSLPWLDMYPNEVTEVQRQLTNATVPKGLFDKLQRCAEHEIAATLAK
ncbi:hypothetical protein PHMEG_00014764 [Phytophthora megakarya]|uniref:Uncharacterized protein n=1 Tax=Phytophthora megakarya TaxID=4795 RepID=A0A225W4K1_9STRA|nr:hypothetical protein PHMEG_00014764 [Phytophthora megakarya]